MSLTLLPDPLPQIQKAIYTSDAVCMQALRPCTKHFVEEYGCKIASSIFLKSMLSIKFRFSEKATKIWLNLPLCLTLISNK